MGAILSEAKASRPRSLVISRVMGPQWPENKFHPEIREVPNGEPLLLAGDFGSKKNEACNIYLGGGFNPSEKY